MASSCNTPAPKAPPAFSSEDSLIAQAGGRSLLQSQRAQRAVALKMKYPDPKDYSRRLMELAYSGDPEMLEIEVAAYLDHVPAESWVPEMYA